MSISAVSSSAASSYYSQASSQSHTSQPAPAAQAQKKDTVSISPQAQQLASDGDPAALEAQETKLEKSSEATKGKA